MSILSPEHSFLQFEDFISSIPPAIEDVSLPCIGEGTDREICTTPGEEYEVCFNAEILSCGEEPPVSGSFDVVILPSNTVLGTVNATGSYCFEFTAEVNNLIGFIGTGANISSIVINNTGREVIVDDCSEPVEESCHNCLPCLPIDNLGDIAFQVNIEEGTVIGSEYFLHLCQDCEELTEVALADIVPEQILTALDANNHYFDGANLTDKALPFTQGKQFKICIIIAPVDIDGIPSGDGQILSCSNCFKVEAADCYNSLIEYYNEESSMGFEYGSSGAVVNRVRLRFYLSKPAFPEEKGGYQLSTGIFKKLFHRINKTYQLKTDYFLEDWHECLKIALSHDAINIKNTLAGIDDSVYCDEEYSIGWIDKFDYPLAMAETKIYLNKSRASLNSNCKP